MPKKRYIIKPWERGHRPRLSESEKTVNTSYTMLESFRDRVHERGGSKYIRTLIARDNADLRQKEELI